MQSAYGYDSILKGFQLVFCYLKSYKLMQFTVLLSHIPIANLSCLRPHMLLFPSLFQRRTLFA